MNSQELFEQVKQVIADALNINKEQISDNSSREDIDNWDSMGHLNIIMAIERKFNVSFSTEEAINSASVLQLAKVLEGKLNEN